MTRAQEIVEDVRQLPADERMDVLRGFVGLVAPSLSADQENGVTEALDERYQVPTAAGASITMKRDSLEAYSHPGGSIWKEILGT